MAVEGCGFTGDDEGGVALRDHAVLMALDGTRALVALPGDGAVHDCAFVGAGDDLAAVACCVAYSDDASHLNSPIGWPGFHAAAIALARLISRLDRCGSMSSADTVEYSVTIPLPFAYRIAVR